MSIYRSQRGAQGWRTRASHPLEKFDIHGVDKVITYEENGKITIKRPVSRDVLTEGYRQCAAESEALEEETTGVLRESNRYVGDAPDW